MKFKKKIKLIRKEKLIKKISFDEAKKLCKFIFSSCFK